MKLSVIFIYLCAAAMLAAQTGSLPTPPDTQPTAETPSNAPVLQPGTTQAPPDKRIFGVLPNYRTANASTVYTPITTRQKFIIGAKDSFDYPLFLVAGATAGLGQITNQNPSFGQGLAGYGRRLGTGYADQVIGNMMTESIFPTLLHEDPRYFRLGSGSKWSRAWYAATRVFVTRTDSGGTRFNFSEVVGNATAVAIANSYYPDGRTAGDNLERLGQQIAIDSVSQVLKEFWPDVKRRFFQKHQDTK